MNIYIFQRVQKLTDNYHSGGGLAIVAEDITKAKALVANHECIELTEEEWKNNVCYPLTGGQTPRIFIFKDAGCC